MLLELGRPPRALKLYFVLLALCAFSLPGWAAEKMRLRVDDYQIEADLNPHAHKLIARAKVKFTALEDLNVATFELNNALRVTKVLDANNKPLSPERVTQDSTVRVPLPTGLTKDSTTTLTFDYEGVLDGDESLVQGLKLANVGDDTSYLLYGGRWFPVNGYGINRFTSTISITVPAHMMVIGSGRQTVGTPAKPTPSRGINRAFPAASWRARFRSSRAMRPVWIFTFSSSPRIKRWGLNTPPRRLKSSLIS